MYTAFKEKVYIIISLIQKSLNFSFWASVKPNLVQFSNVRWQFIHLFKSSSNPIFCPILACLKRFHPIQGKIEVKKVYIMGKILNFSFLAAVKQIMVKFSKSRWHLLHLECDRWNMTSKIYHSSTLFL